MSLFRSFFIFIFALLTAIPAVAKDADFEIAVNRNRLTVGQSLQMNLVFRDSQDIPAVDLSGVDGFQARYVGPSTNMTIVNGKMSSSISHIYMLSAVRTGTFTIGPLRFEHKGVQYVSNSVTVIVSDAAAAPPQSGDTSSEDAGQKLSDRVFVVIEVPKKKLYLNEVVPVTVRLFVNQASIRDVQYPEVSHDGFSLGQFDKPKQYRDVLGGIQYEVLEFTAQVFGLNTGELTLGPAVLHCNLVMKKRSRRPLSGLDEDFFDSSIFDDFFGGYESVPIVLRSTEIPVSVLPVPEEGKPADFSGAMGEFRFEAVAGPEQVAVGDPVTVKAVVSGTGNFSSVVLPKFENRKDLKVYEPKITQEAGSKTFEQIVMPLNDSVKEIPEISFSFFNTVTGQYETLRQGPFPISVLRQEKQQESRLIEAAGGHDRPAPALKPETLGKDIVFIKESVSGVGASRRYVYEDPLTWVVWIFVALLYGAVHGIYAWKRRLSTDTAFAGKLNAPKAARRGIAAARQYCSAGRQAEFFDAVFTTMREYLGHKYHLPVKGLTFANVQSALEEQRVAAEWQEIVREIFDACDMARYAPGRVSPDMMKDILGKLQDVVQYLEKQGNKS